MAEGTSREGGQREKCIDSMTELLKVKGISEEDAWTMVNDPL